MSQDHSALFPVTFRGATLHLIDHKGEPFVAMRPIVEAMGLDWNGQRVKLKDRYATCVEEISTKIEGDTQRRAMTCLPLRKLAGWLMTIHPNKVRPELRDTIRAYQAECDDALWAYWTQRAGVKDSLTAHRAIPLDLSGHVRDHLMTHRFILSFDWSGAARLDEIPADAFVLPAAKWASVIRTPDFPRHLLADVLAAVSARLKENRT